LGNISGRVCLCLTKKKTYNAHVNTRGEVEEDLPYPPNKTPLKNLLSGKKDTIFYSNLQNWHDKKKHWEEKTLKKGGW